MTVIAVPQAPQIVCPSWCTVSHHEHVAQLPDFDGRVTHWSPTHGADQECHIQFAAMGFVDGTLDPKDEPRLYVSDAGYQDGATLDQVESYARLLLEIVEEYRR